MKPGSCRAILHAALLSLVLCASARALPGDLTLSSLYHTQWTLQDGAPSGISGIAQTRDGYIWLSAGGRLFRFDGVEFERVELGGRSQLPTEKIYSMWARPQGGLWLSYSYGGATFLGEDRIDNYFTEEGLPANTVTDFAQDGTGDMWAGTTRGLMRLEAGAWTFASSSWGVPQMYVEDTQLDRDGTLWVVVGEQVFYLRQGSRRFEPGLRLGPIGTGQRACLISSPDGATWLLQPNLGLSELRTPAPGKPVTARWRKRGFRATDPAVFALIDRDSHLWLASRDGVMRMPLNRSQDFDADATTTGDAIDERVGSAGESPAGMLEDREGNIWVISNGGLDKFRASSFARVPLPPGAEQIALAPTNDGSLWIGTAGPSLRRFADGVEREVANVPGATIEALHVDRQGTLWLGGSGNAIWQRRAGQWLEWRPDDNEARGGIQAIASEPGGALWVSIVRAGVYRVVDNRWTLWGGRGDLPMEPATTLTLDLDGRLWLGYINNRIAVLDRAGVTIYDAADGLSTGAVQAIAVGGRNIWIGSERGVSWFDGRRFHRLEGAGHGAFAGVSGIVEKAPGDLWLNSSDGAIHIAAAEVRKFIAEPSRTVQFRQFNYLDGMPGAPRDIRPQPSIAGSTDGRIWFASTHGVVSLAPGSRAPNPIVPNVYIKAIVVDGIRYPLDPAGKAPLQLPTHPRDLQIAYTALSFAIPERVHFRYQLEGTNMGWQDVGTRREAYFTELPPGNYRFQVLASNDAGLWNETGATVQFVIPPTFLQSRKFIVLCMLSASASLWLLYLLRMRHVKAQLQSHSEARSMERERIARELHDTFLQGVQGLMLRFQSATERIPESEPARKLMEDALDRADRVLAEGRDKVSELRASISSNLPESLAMVGTELSRDYPVAFESKVEGTPRALRSLVQEEAYRIGAEALANAFRHARATHIGASVQFGRRYFTIRVHDDGKGFDVSSPTPGRWGIKGMCERTERIRGRLTVSSQSGGTTVELLVPAKHAYKRAEHKRRPWSIRMGTIKTEIPR